MMRKLWTAIAGSFVMLLVMMPSLALAAKYFTILTIIIIPTVGCIFGFLADVVMSHIGIDLKHRELAEH